MTYFHVMNLSLMYEQNIAMSMHDGQTNSVSTEAHLAHPASDVGIDNVNGSSTHHFGMHAMQVFSLILDNIFTKMML